VHVGPKKVHLVVENPDGVSRGIATMILDGAPFPSNRIGARDLVGDGAHEVRVRLGSPRMTSRVSATSGVDVVGRHVE
jgi:hypothetical protein